ncbi:MAG: M3 family metallopeptidase [Pseudomonadota bacterium]
MNNPLLDTSTLPRFADIAPEHVVPALNELIADHRRRLDDLLETAADPSFDSLVLPLEEMEHELSRVWSPVSHLQSVLGSREWRQAYNEALPILTEHGTELSQNVRLQQAYSKVDGTFDDGADEARRAAVEHALREFRLAGVDLPMADKERFRFIMRELASLQARFDHNVQDASDAWLLHIDDEAVLDGLPGHLCDRAATEAREAGREGWLLKLDFPTYDAVMKLAADRSLRENFYHAWSTRGSDEGADPSWDNSETIKKILTLRHEAAQLVGFDSYADYSLATKMASTPGEVIEFLRELAARTRAAAQRELDELSEFSGMTIEPWDVTFWLEKLKQERYSISNEVLSEYFPATNTINGLFDVASRLYGVTLKRNNEVTTWNDEVRYFEVFDGRGALIGSFYADLYARSGKRTGAWISDCVNRKSLNGQTTLPVGYLVANFAPPINGKDSLLTHTDIVTLFHEFGHMLHHLLTRIDVPSVAGINGVPWDAVELPSQFMENFAWNYDVLERCSSHHETGEPLPRELFERLEQSRHVGAALAMLRQIEFGLFDIRLHSEYAADTSVLDLLDEVRDEVSLIRHPAYNRMPHGFAHIFSGGYAAGYYSYKWAEVLAADAFGAFEEAGVFDRDTAERFRHEILEIGGSRDFMQAYVAFRGREPSMDALLRLSGIGADA